MFWFLACTHHSSRELSTWLVWKVVKWCESGYNKCFYSVKICVASLRDCVAQTRVRADHDVDIVALLCDSKWNDRGCHPLWHCKSLIFHHDVVHARLVQGSHSRAPADVGLMHTLPTTLRPISAAHASTARSRGYLDGATRERKSYPRCNVLILISKIYQQNQGIHSTFIKCVEQ